MKRLFIIGVGRSGTSLLQSMLNVHSAIAFLPETQFLRNYVWNKEVWRGPNEFQNRLGSDNKYSRVRDIEITSEYNSPLEYYNLLCDSFLKIKSKVIVGDKDPRNIDYIKQLHNTFSTALLIHIIRDPRDAVLSRTKADWSKKWPFLLQACIYETQIKRGQKELDSLDSAYKIQIKYEDLIAEPTDVLKKILVKLNLGYERSMLSFNQSAAELTHDSELQWKGKTLKPLDPGNSEKWKKSFTPLQVALVESICRDSMTRNGYRFSSLKLSFLERVLVVMSRLVFALFYLVYPARYRL